MPEYHFSPHTGEHIETATPADWMGSTSIAPPAYDRATQGAFFRGGAWEVETAQPPAAPVPQQVTRAQGKVVLIQMGLWQPVLDYVAGIADSTQKAVAEVALHDTQFWQRSSPFLAQAAAALGMTDAQLDDLFVRAEGVVL
ncbi:hypothetical protein [Hydrogenophaga aquatica]